MSIPAPNADSCPRGARSQFLSSLCFASAAAVGFAVGTGRTSAADQPPAASGAAPNAAASADPPDGFVPLFEGRDFSGWRFDDRSPLPAKVPTAWRIEQGMLVGAGDPAVPLASQWDYEDFEFEFEWRARAEDFDADVYVHAGRLLDADPIRIAPGLEGGPQENDRGEGGYNAGPKGLIGGGGKNRTAVPQLQKPVGEWNAWRIVARAGTLVLVCNGREAWRCDDHVPRRGYLGFRVFKGPLELRNLRLRESGFRSLMDLDEWEVYPGFGGRGPLAEHWRRDGLVWTFRGTGPSIVTKRKDFADYRLRLEFLFADPDPTDTNSGVYLRGVHPWQADIWEHKWGSGLWGLLHAYVPAKKNLDDLGKAVRPQIRMDNPQGHWNYLDVRVERDVVSVWLNGRTTIDRFPIREVDPKFPSAGGIGLQAHWPWKEVRYRNLRVRTSGPAPR